MSCLSVRSAAAPRALLRSSLAIAAAAWGVVACADGSAASRIELSFEPSDVPVRVDAGCLERCAATAMLEVAYPDDLFAPRERIEFVAYRVDYDFARDIGEIPFHAGPLALSLIPGDVQNLRVTIVGQRQRAALAEHAAGREDPLSGRATLQLAGYDWNDEQVFVEIEASLRVD